MEDIYNSRPLPFIIGTADFQHSLTGGIYEEVYEEDGGAVDTQEGRGEEFTHEEVTASHSTDLVVTSSSNARDSYTSVDDAEYRPPQRPNIASIIPRRQDSDEEQERNSNEWSDAPRPLPATSTAIVVHDQADEESDNEDIFSSKASGNEDPYSLFASAERKSITYKVI